jgi:hypothetical protein
MTAQPFLLVDPGGAPPASRTTRKWLLIATVAVLVLAGASVAAFLRIATAPRVVATRYLTAIEHDDPARAYSLLCPQLALRTSPGGLRHVFAVPTARYGPLRSFHITGVRTGGGQSFVTYTFTRTTQSGADLMTLSRVAGRWTVCGNVTISTARRVPA